MIATVAKVFGKTYAPIHISCSHFDVNEQLTESIQNHVSKMSQTVVQFYPPYIHVSKIIQTIAQFYAPYLQICKLIESYTDTGSPIMDFDASSILCNHLSNFMTKHCIKLNGDEEHTGLLRENVNGQKNKSAIFCYIYNLLYF